MHNVLLVGAGKIGSAIAKLLQDTGDYHVRVADVSADALSRLPNGVEPVEMPVTDADKLAEVTKDRHSVLSAVSFDANPAIATAALNAGADYLDLTEDVVTTKKVRDIAANAKDGQRFIPQCGLAPGFVSIAANDLAKHFTRLDRLHLRVGALPIFPTNELKYNLTWSTDGLINEYGNPCEAVIEGQKIDVLPLEGYEQFSLDGVMYEAFNTSGGVGTLAETLAGKARKLDYKTIRYRGHRDLVKFLMFDLRMNEHRDDLKTMLERAIPMTPQDVVLIFCTAIGEIDGQLMQMTDARKVYHGDFRGLDLSGIQITTASAICAVLDLIREDKLATKKGFVKQEEIALEDFLANRFGQCYATGRDGVEVIEEPYVPTAV
ncbi:MAG: saccharopine dehydrogenase C-terminal domain-containing protein [Planctomycetota bacterium]